MKLISFVGELLSSNSSTLVKTSDGWSLVEANVVEATASPQKLLAVLDPSRSAFLCGVDPDPIDGLRKTLDHFGITFDDCYTEDPEGLTTFFDEVATSYSKLAQVFKPWENYLDDLKVFRLAMSVLTEIKDKSKQPLLAKVVTETKTKIKTAFEHAAEIVKDRGYRPTQEPNHSFWVAD